MKNTKNWSTEKVNRFLQNIEDGLVDISKGPYHDRNDKYRKANMSFDYTIDEINEIAKCAKDVIYFAEKHATVMTDDGLMKIKLRDYQKDLLEGFSKNRFNINLASRF